MWACEGEIEIWIIRINKLKPLTSSYSRIYFRSSKPVDLRLNWKHSIFFIIPTSCLEIRYIQKAIKVKYVAVEPTKQKLLLFGMVIPTLL